MAIYWMDEVTVKGESKDLQAAFPFCTPLCESFSMSTGGRRWPGFDGFSEITKQHPDIFIILKRICDVDFYANIYIYHKGQSVQVYDQNNETSYHCDFESLYKENKNKSRYFENKSLKELAEFFNKRPESTVIEINEETEVGYISLDEEND